jgi:hypothetical protein
VTHRHSGQRLLDDPSRLKWNHLRTDAAWARLIREARRVLPEPFTIKLYSIGVPEKPGQ